MLCVEAVKAGGMDRKSRDREDEQALGNYENGMRMNVILMKASVVLSLCTQGTPGKRVCAASVLTMSSGLGSLTSQPDGIWLFSLTASCG